MAHYNPDLNTPKSIVDLAHPTTEKKEHKTEDLLNEPKKTDKDASDFIQDKENVFAKLGQRENEGLLGEGKRKGEGIAQEAPEPNVPDMTPKRRQSPDDNLAATKE